MQYRLQYDHVPAGLANSTLVPGEMVPAVLVRGVHGCDRACYLNCFAFYCILLPHMYCLVLYMKIAPLVLALVYRVLAVHTVHALITCTCIHTGYMAVSIMYTIVLDIEWKHICIEMIK